MSLKTECVGLVKLVDLDHIYDKMRKLLEQY